LRSLGEADFLAQFLQNCLQLLHLSQTISHNRG
jgi:hypothetical protein